MFLHLFARPLAMAGFPFYFKKIYIIGDSKVWRDKPTLICSNHPTGFFEPMLYSVCFPEIPFRYITRGDTFRKPVLGAMLRSMGLVPIFRFSDGFSSLRENTELLPQFTKLLSEKEKIIIFSEGSTKTTRQIRPLQKGLARIAFDTFKEYGDIDLQILPACVTYTSPHDVRSEAYVKLGEPIAVRDLIKAYEENQVATIADLTKNLRVKMRALIAYVELPEREPLAQHFIDLYTNTYTPDIFPVYDHSSRRFNALQEITAHVNNFSDADVEKYQSDFDHYYEKINRLNLQDKTVAQPFQDNLRTKASLALGYLPYLIGKYAHRPIVAKGEKYRLNVRRHEFKGPLHSVFMLGYGVGFYLFLIIVSLVLNFVFDKRFFLIIALLMPFIGFYAIHYSELRSAYQQKKIADALSTETLQQLRNERAELLKVVFR